MHATRLPWGNSQTKCLDRLRGAVPMQKLSLEYEGKFSTRYLMAVNHIHVQSGVRNWICHLIFCRHFVPFIGSSLYKAGADPYSIVLLPFFILDTLFWLVSYSPWRVIYQTKPVNQQECLLGCFIFFSNINGNLWLQMKPNFDIFCISPLGGPGKCSSKLCKIVFQSVGQMQIDDAMQGQIKVESSARYEAWQSEIEPNSYYRFSKIHLISHDRPDNGGWQGSTSSCQDWTQVISWSGLQWWCASSVHCGHVGAWKSAASCKR